MVSLNLWVAPPYPHPKAKKARKLSCSAVSNSLQPRGLYVAHQAPPSMGFSRQEYWSGLPFPSPGDLPDPGIKPRSPALQADTLTSEPLGKPSPSPWPKSQLPPRSQFTFLPFVRPLCSQDWARITVWICSPSTLLSNIPSRARHSISAVMSQTLECKRHT